MITENPHSNQWHNSRLVLWFLWYRLQTWLAMVLTNFDSTRAQACKDGKWELSGYILESYWPHIKGTIDNSFNLLNHGPRAGPDDGRVDSVQSSGLLRPGSPLWFRKLGQTLLRTLFTKSIKTQSIRFKWQQWVLGFVLCWQIASKSREINLQKVEVVVAFDLHTLGKTNIMNISFY